MLGTEVGFHKQAASAQVLIITEPSLCLPHFLTNERINNVKGKDRLDMVKYACHPNTQDGDRQIKSLKFKDRFGGLHETLSKK